MKRNNGDILEIDGSFGEGGGQIVRTALFLSILTNIPVRIFNIRKKRKDPGLKHQHLEIMRTLKKISPDCEIENAKLGATEIFFRPGKPRGGNFTVDIQTAGSITLFLQTVFPTLLFAEYKSRLRVRGGTDVPMAMTSDYFKHVVLTYYTELARKMYFLILRRGYYPKGGGIVEIEIEPKFPMKNFKSFDDLLKKLREMVKPLDLTHRGKLLTTELYLTVSESLKDRKVMERIRDRLLNNFRRNGFKVEEICTYTDSLSPGCSVFLKMKFESGLVTGCDEICRLGVPSEKISDKIFEKFLNIVQDEDNIVDKHLQDNLILVLALAGGKLRVRELSNHTISNIWVVERFLNLKFQHKDGILSVVF